MIRSVPAILRTTLRQFWATRSLIWLFVATSAPPLLFPMTLQGDGTASGRMQMVLLYTSVAIFACTLIGSIWMAAYTLASDRSELRLSLLRTKPVSGISVWLGKWLAMGVVQASALSLGFSILLCMLFLQSSHNHTREHFAIWQPFTPDQTAIHNQAHEIMQAQKNQQASPTPSAAQILNRLKQQKYRVAPGGAVSWNIPLSPKKTFAQDWQLRFQWRLNPMQRTPVTGTWTLKSHDNQTVIKTHEVQDLLDGHHVVNWGQVQIPANTSSLTLTFQSEKDNTSFVFFSTKSPIVLCQKKGSLYTNIFLTGLLLLACCTSVSAIALTLSASLSFPVTVFATHGGMFALLIAGIAGRPPAITTPTHHHASMENWLQSVTRTFLDHMHMLTASLRDILPFHELSRRLTILYHEHIFDWVVLLIILPLLMGLLAHIQFTKAEVPQ